MSTKPKLKEYSDTKDVFVNDFFSKETFNLLNYAKSLKEVGYRRVYPMACKLYTKMRELSRPKLIKSVGEVDSLLLESTKKRRSLHRGDAALDTSGDSENEADNACVSP